MSLTEPPGDMPMWYVRALMVYTLCAPLLSRMLSVRSIVMRWVIVCLLLTVYSVAYCWLFSGPRAQYCYPAYSFAAFVLGGVLAINGVSIERMTTGRIAALFCSIGFATFVVRESVPLPLPLQECLRAFNAFFLISLGGLLSPLIKCRIGRAIMHHGFFLYASHLLVLTVVSRLILHVPYNTTALLAFFLSVGFCIWVARCIARLDMPLLNMLCRK